MNVSTPESTVFDLVRYVSQSGYLGNVATVLTELSEMIDPKKLLVHAQKEKLVIIQRAGYLLATYGVTGVCKLLLPWLKLQKPTVVSLRTDKGHTGSEKDVDWQVWINEKIEVDL